jgi:hypothetical protein
MDDALRIALVVVVLVAGASLSTGGPNPVERPVPANVTADGSWPPLNETEPVVNRLRVGDEVVSGSLTPKADASTAVSTGDSEFGEQLPIYESLRSVRVAESPDANNTAIRDALDRTQGQIEDLRDYERAAVRAYYEGAIGTRELLQRLARTDARAESIGEGFRYFVERSRETLRDSSLSFQQEQRAGWIVEDLGAFETPVRNRLADAFRGSRRGSRVRVAASSNGMVLETIVDGRYVRDAVRFDHYRPSDPSRVRAVDALDILINRYPSLYRSSARPDETLDQIGLRLYRLSLEYPMGQTVVFLDRTTNKTYRELHVLRLERIPTGAVADVENDGIRLVVNRTKEGNPYLVRTLEAGTNDPVNATIAIDGRQWGTTGDDGRLWVLGSADGFSLTATAGTRSVAVELPGWE